MARILVLDDNESVRIFIRDTLQMMGHQVVEAQDGVDGLHKIKQSPPSLAIIDLYLPDTAGTTVIRQLLQHLPSMKIIAISGAATKKDQELLEHALKAGALRALPKPFPIQTLLDMVHDVLTLSSTN